MQVWASLTLLLNQTIFILQEESEKVDMEESVEFKAIEVLQILELIMLIEIIYH